MNDWPNCCNPLEEKTGEAEAIEQLVEDYLSRLTMPEKVGQMIQAELASVTPEDAKNHALGSILNGGGVFPNDNKHASVQDWWNLAQEFVNASKQSSSGIPILWGTDAVHGHNNVIGATLFPHNIGLGASGNLDLIEALSRATAEDVVATGIGWVFGPNLAVAQDYRWGRTFESFSEDPEKVAECGAAAARGLLGSACQNGYIETDSVIATSKHFLGEGATSEGIDQGNAICSEKELREKHACGHLALLEQGVPTVMAAFNSWNGSKVHGDQYLLTQVLKEHIGFTGLLISDWDGFLHLDEDFDTSCIKCVNAGVDVLMVSSDWRRVLNALNDGVQEGRIKEERIDDAVRRILRVKALKRLLVPEGAESKSPATPRRSLASSHHDELAREAVQHSLVLLKNNHQTLPLSREQKILVVGSAADDLGQQCGGWTITWQGTNNSRSDFPHGNSILDGIREIVEPSNGNVTYLEELGDKPDADVAIVVFGEQPYAEGEGDLNHLNFSAGNRQPLESMHRLKEAGIPVVAVFLTGRPLWINPELNAADAFVVAWLPGTQAGAMASVLFESTAGQEQLDFVGKLSFSWPARPDQCCVNFDDPSEAPLFPLGYGLTYADGVQELDSVPEQHICDAPFLRGPKYQGSYNYPK